MSDSLEEEWKSSIQNNLPATWLEDQDVSNFLKWNEKMPFLRRLSLSQNEPPTTDPLKILLILIIVFSSLAAIGLIALCLFWLRAKHERKQWEEEEKRLKQEKEQQEMARVQEENAKPKTIEEKEIISLTNLTHNGGPGGGKLISLGGNFMFVEPTPQQNAQNTQVVYIVKSENDENTEERERSRQKKSRGRRHSRSSSGSPTPEEIERRAARKAEREKKAAKAARQEKKKARDEKDSKRPLRFSEERYFHGNGI